MSMTRAELQDAAHKAFDPADLVPDAAKSWGLIAEMGWLMMAVPEELGGLGLGVEAAGVTHMALGRALVPGPAIAQMLVITALTAADGLPERDDLLTQAMGGAVMTASLAGYSVAGGLTCVPDADRASHVLVIEDRRIALMPVDAQTLTARATWDKTRRLFDIAIDASATGFTLAEGDAATALAERLQAQRLFALSGDSLGGADAILRLTIEYLETRRQFDRPLAMFQALKHRVADMKTWLAAAEALFWARGNDPAVTLAEMGALKAHTTTVYRTIAEEAVQLHGGIGLTMEHHCHLFLKRALLNCALGGDADQWEEMAGRQALAQATA
ncbi:acyl-CoA dehydrogenase [Sphingobium boeckii]|uniref:Alkylation response protein AidB-like acyl-CoA dehydrogenase n=1 Tax=Sphingobium boeckii TaxID=1082345 RepID=A0A7W9AJQ2_9SPHN|nr:acyl-CoA dehydrogenase [Sphingobium boeckii]MBB5686711.1 alkylation response protein AidB-like acyl-CoA dehydrogenase [Sphingobium boeckii]